MPVPQELLDTIKEYEKQGAKPEDLIPELVKSKTYPEIATKFQDYILLGGDPLDIYEGLKKSPVASKGDFMRDYVKPMVDTAIGIPESVVTITSGIASFFLGIGAAGGSFLHQIAKQGNFEGLSWVKSKEAMDKAMELGTWKPQTELAKTAAGVVGAPFELYNRALNYGAEKLGLDEEGKAAVTVLGNAALLALPKVVKATTNVASRVRLSRAEQALRRGDIEGAGSEILEVTKRDPEAAKAFNDEVVRFEDTMRAQMELPEMKGLPKKEGYKEPIQPMLERKEVEKIEVPGKKKKITVERIHRPFEGLEERLPQEELPFKPYWYEETKKPEQADLPGMWDEYKGAVEKRPAFEVRVAETEALIDRIKMFGKDYLEQRDRAETYAKIEADKLRLEMEGMRTAEEIDSVKRIAEAKVAQGRDYARWMAEEMRAMEEELVKRGLEVPEEAKPATRSIELPEEVKTIVEGIKEVPKVEEKVVAKPTEAGKAVEVPKSELDIALEEGFKAKAEKLGIEFTGMSKEGLPEFRTKEGVDIKPEATQTIEEALGKAEIKPTTVQPMVTPKPIEPIKVAPEIWEKIKKTDWWKELDEETQKYIAKDNFSETLRKDIEGEERVKEAAKAENKTVEEVTKQPELIEDSTKVIDELTPPTREEMVKTYLEMTIARGKSKVELDALLKKKFPTEKGLNNFFEALKRGDLEHSFEDVLGRIEDKAGEIFTKDAENPIWNEDGFIDLSPIITVPKEFFGGIMETIKSLGDRGIKKEDLRAIAVAEAARAIRLQASYYKSTGQFLPKRQVMKLPPFRKSYEAGKKFTKNIEMDRLEWVYNGMDKLLNRLPKEIKANFYNLMQMDINKVPLQFKSVVMEHRAFWDKLIQKGKDVGYDIGYKLNYLPHMFEEWGVLTTDDIHGRFFRNERDAIKYGREIEAQGKTILKIEPNYTIDIATLDKKTANVLERLKRDMTYTVEEGKKLPDEKFFGNWLARRSENPYYKTNYPDIMRAYTQGVIKKIHSDILIKEIGDIIKEAGPELGREGRSVILDYAESVLGRPAWIENAIANFAVLMGRDVTPYGVMNMSKKAALLQYNLDLGIVVSSAISNSFQTMNAVALMGHGNMAVGSAKAFKALMGIDKARYKELVDGGIIQEVPAGLEMTFKNKLAAAPLVLFQSVERWNRASTYFAAKSYARADITKAKRLLKNMDVPEAASVYKLEGEKFVEAFADEMVDNTQFRTEPFNIPGVIRSPIMKTAIPYKGFAIEQHAFMYKLVKNTFKDPKMMAPILAQFIALSYLVGGKEANVLTDTTYMASDEAFKRVFGMSIQDVEFDTPAGKLKFGDILRRGLPAHLGLDISGAVSIQNPISWFRKGQNAFGRYLQFAYALGSWDTETMWKSILPRFVVKGKTAYPVATEGKYKTWRGHKIADVPKKDAYKIMAGWIPPKVSEVFREREAKFDLHNWYRKNVLLKIDEAVGYSEDKNAVKGQTTLKDISKERQGYFEQFTVAKPGSHKERLRQRIMMIDRALNSVEIFENARKRRREGVLERENDAILKSYSIRHMRELFGEEYVRPIEEEEY